MLPHTKGDSSELNDIMDFTVSLTGNDLNPQVTVVAVV